MTECKPSTWWRLAVLLLAMLALGARAEDRALLVGVGQYRDASANLPGIDIDIGAMREVAQGLGFQPAAVKVLTHHDATLANLRSALQQWLVDGVGPDDRVLLYYSGHGTQVPDEDGDEADGLDEALTLHDLGRVTRPDGKVALGGVMLDDELAEWLARIPSQQVLVLIDACHSGTATRAYPGQDDAVPKFYRDPLLAASTLVVNPPTRREAMSDNYLAISAAADDEQSLATPRGSLFTQAVREAIAVARRSGQTSVRALWHQATQAIAAKLEGPRRFSPQLTGNLALADRPVPLAPSAEAATSPSAHLEALVKGSGGVRVRFDRALYREGERMVIELNLERAGYLNVVAVGPDAAPVVLFPNREHPHPRVLAGRMRLPTPEMKLRFIASRPYGSTLVAAFVTDAPIDLYRLAPGPRDAQGHSIELLGRLSDDGVRQLQALRAGGTGFGAGHAVAVVCSAAGLCQ